MDRQLLPTTQLWTTNGGDASSFAFPVSNLTERALEPDPYSVFAITFGFIALMQRLGDAWPARLNVPAFIQAVTPLNSPSGEFEGCCVHVRYGNSGDIIKCRFMDAEWIDVYNPPDAVVERTRALLRACFGGRLSNHAREFAAMRHRIAAALFRYFENSTFPTTETKDQDGCIRRNAARMFEPIMFFSLGNGLSETALRTHHPNQSGEPLLPAAGSGGIPGYNALLRAWNLPDLVTWGGSCLYGKGYQYGPYEPFIDEDLKPSFDNTINDYQIGEHAESYVYSEYLPFLSAILGIDEVATPNPHAVRPLAWKMFPCDFNSTLALAQGGCFNYGGYLRPTDPYASNLPDTEVMTSDGDLRSYGAASFKGVTASDVNEGAKFQIIASDPGWWNQYMAAPAVEFITVDFSAIKSALRPDPVDLSSVTELLRTVLHVLGEPAGTTLADQLVELLTRVGASSGGASVLSLLYNLAGSDASATSIPSISEMVGVDMTKVNALADYVRGPLFLFLQKLEALNRRELAALANQVGSAENLTAATVGSLAAEIAKGGK